MRRFVPLFCTALVPLLASGCATDSGDYPSLARRPAERVSTAAVPAPTASAEPAPTVDPAQEAQAARLLAQARAGHERFLARHPRARQLVAAASGAAKGSENWAVATVALADLESARSTVMIALADLDGLYARARIETGDAGQIARSRNAVIALVAEEDGIIAGLGQRLAR